MIASGPVLGIIQDTGDLVLYVDSSLYATGCVLQQYQENGTVLGVLRVCETLF